MCLELRTFGSYSYLPLRHAASWKQSCPEIRCGIFSPCAASIVWLHIATICFFHKKGDSRKSWPQVRAENCNQRLGRPLGLRLPMAAQAARSRSRFGTQVSQRAHSAGCAPAIFASDVPTLLGKALCACTPLFLRAHVHEGWRGLCHRDLQLLQ